MSNKKVETPAPKPAPTPQPRPAPNTGQTVSKNGKKS